MSSEDDRAELARQQSSILSALRAGTTPEGFSAPQLAQAGRSLYLKRQREARAAAPVLAGALGKAFDERFRNYAAAHGYPARGPAADAAGFGRYLVRRKEFPAAALAELLRLRARTGFWIQFHSAMGRLGVTMRIADRVWIFPLNRGAG